MLCVFLLFYIDAIVFPTLPELFTIIIFSVDPTIGFAAEVLITIAIAEVLGLLTLYIIVKRLKVPKKISEAVKRYSGMLVVKNEKIILLNRIAPVLPFMGAFVAMCGWDLRRSVAYTIIGGMTKYGTVLALSALFYAYLSSGAATLVTMALVIGVIAVSLVLSYIKKKDVPKTSRPG
ncbi:MAG: hypothetical protein HPY73_08425 [Methanomassiliicoccales archaeon]|nr:MAG: hypothetical protein HPY73_08425 [Methanomassiliicoccales archaeon]